MTDDTSKQMQSPSYRLAALDPEADAIEAALAFIVTEFGAPTGPTRGVCSQILQEWQQTRLAPEAWSWLISEAISSGDPGDENHRRGKRRRRPLDAP
jgi:hypothetical protein